MLIRRIPPGFLAAVFLVIAEPVRAADPLPYTVDISGIDGSDVDAAVRASSQLVTLARTAPVPPFALITRVREDIPRIQTALDSFGYYQNSVSVTVMGLGSEDPALPSRLDALAQGTPAPVKITVTMGPLYHIGRITLQGTVPERDRSGLGLNSGDPAVASTVLGAQNRLLTTLQEDGYALAKVGEPDATADDIARTINVVYKVDAGPQVDIGDITFKGLTQVNESFVRRALTIHPGDRYRPSRIEAARQTLTGLGVFSGVSVRAADRLSADGRIPLVFDVQERQRHAVTIAGNYSTDLGISLSTTWSHRNLFGNAEQLNLTAAGMGLGSSTAGLGYNLVAQYIQPLFLEQDQTLEFDVSGIKQQLDAYDQVAETVAGFVRRKFSALWSGSAGLSLTHDQITQEGSTRLYELIALPVTVNYDSTGIADQLRDPVSGLRASATLAPTHAFGAEDITFLIAQISASTYFDVSGGGRSVIALRGLAGSIMGGSNLGLPPDQRLYAGGTATVRGYAYQSIGPQFPDGKPVGAKSVDAATVEFRQRFGDDWGAAAFVDAGQAGTGSPFTGKLFVGAGGGARYYTPIGAVRLDFGVPLTRVPHGDSFELYIGLGQAF
ncbi:MAG TPA: BamA/TamA family outer membrane protein [Rhizomicrobium sp.]|nr:BamA/TamA family outer membrane protein [Rhizomicrobium sp.]